MKKFKNFSFLFLFCFIDSMGETCICEYNGKLFLSGEDGFCHYEYSSGNAAVVELWPCNDESSSSSSSDVSSSSSSDISSSSTDIESSSSGYDISTDQCTIDGEDWKQMSPFPFLKRTLYYPKPAMLEKENIYIKECDCNGIESFYCLFGNFGLVHNYTPGLISFCGFSNGYWCEGIEGGTCSFNGSTVTIYYSDIHNINGSNWGAMGIDGLRLEAIENGPQSILYYRDSITGLPTHILLYDNFVLPSNVYLSNLENKILEYMPDFPHISGINSYCRGEWEHPVNCYGNNRAANAEILRRNAECEAEGHRPSFEVNDKNCIIGECVKKQEDEYSSSSSNEDNPCLASKPLLQKPVNYYDDWVYIGKERYGSRKASRRLPTLGIKYFDALGRIYEEIMGRKMYYTKEPLVEAYEVPLDFEVYARIVKDSEGNDIQVFIKEDKKNRLRRDSSFYWDGYWEVFEIKGETEITLRNSLGLTTSSIRDNEGKLQERTIKDKDETLIVNDRYVWKDGLLIKEISLNGTRTYHYGKNPYEDTVRVEPSDKGYYFHKGYDGSAGIIPRKGAASYEKFLADPYGIWIIEDELKILSRAYGQYDFVKPSYLLDGIPKPSYRNPSRTDICVINKCKVCPENGDSMNGGSEMELMLESECVVNDCEKYEIQVKSRIWGGMWLQQSILRKSFRPPNNEVYYRRTCRTEGFLLETYYHEALHFENAMYRRHLYTEVYMPKTQFNSFEECKISKFNGEDYILKLWDLWKVAEYNHYNHDSPKVIHNAVKEQECDEIP